MGNSASSSSRGPHDETVDYGYLMPQGVYSGPRDWNESVVGRLIVERKLAPFYRPLEDYDESWSDEKILAARKELPPPPSPDGDPQHTPRSDQSSINSRHSHKRSSASKDLTVNPEAAIYRGAVECPICFLHYPPNINRSRCCDQAICTECFVQIKRSEPTVTHLASDPACCPYCVQEHFGVVYMPPSWRAGLGSEGSSLPPWPDALQRTQSLPSSLGKQKRRKSLGPEDPDVVTIDHIRPDWEAKLQAVRAQAARRANRRIIMRQVGDRLIPVGVTSGRVHALPAELAGGEGGEGGHNGSSARRSRRRQQNDIANILGGMTGPDLEELMVMEAMRLSLLEHEEQQRREREAQERAQAGGEAGSNAAQDGNSDNTPSSSASAVSRPTVAPSGSPTAPDQPISAAVTAAPALAEDSVPFDADSTPMRTPLAGSPDFNKASPVTPTAARPELPSIPVLAESSAEDAEIDDNIRLPPIARTNTTMSTQTEGSVESRVVGSGYGLLSSDSEESVVAREPLLHVQTSEAA